MVDSRDKYLSHVHICVFGIHMKQARVKMSDRTNQVLNIVKAKYNLKDKSAAIELVVARFESEMLEPELKPEYIEKMERIHHEKPVFVGTVDELDKFIDDLPDEDDD
jgi:predicted amidohydrolase YtcJ